MDYVVNDRTGEVHEVTCPRVKVIASKSPWDPAKAQLTPGVYADRICLHGRLPLRGAPTLDRDHASHPERQTLGKRLESLLDEHWPDCGVNPWYLADLLREDPHA